MATNTREREDEQPDPLALAGEQAEYRKKQILAAMLFLGLLIAVWTQPEPQSAEPGVIVDMKLVSQQPQQEPTPTTSTEQSTTLRLTQLSTVRQLGRMELAEIQRLEIFTPEPTAMRDPRLDQRRVQAVYATPDGHAAIVDQSIVRNGEPLPGGVRILGITEQGVEVSR